MAGTDDKGSDIPEPDAFKQFFAPIAMALRHPLKMAGLFSKYNVRMFFSMAGESGFRYALERTFRVMNDSATDISRMEIDSAQSDVQQYDGEHIEIPSSDVPLVSIIIPVYNQFDYTCACIRSVIKNTEGVPYEIILADDCSTDETVNISEHVSNLHVVRNEKNLRFTLNCNNAAKYAKGKYILFLNNDTEVREDWLGSLVDLIESDDRIGLVGSKFIFADGHLQEAGGIIWSDGTAWNYGRGYNPSSPEYNYVREVDYISGASIMIPRDLWNEIGGFDERFAPSYCEDSDLAFEVRRRGYRVMYQPRSEIIHYEGISNGKCVNSGIKAYQKVNMEKFRDKWADVLDREHSPCGKDVFRARDRSFGRRTVLFLNSQVPRYDMDAGSRGMMEYIRLMLEMGYSVKLMCDDFLFDGKYVPFYQQMGVEVLYGADLRKRWKHWITSNADYIDVAFINRPAVGDKYLEFIKKNTSARIVYNICDLHHVRLMKEYEVTGNEASRSASENMREIEYRLMNEADAVITPSSAEEDYINRSVPGDKAKALPLFYFEEPFDAPDDYSVRRDILFVGGFSHRPNEDAVIWFVKDIWPLIRREVPECRFHIVGSSPTQSVSVLRSDDVLVEGFVSDDELDDLYRSCAVCVIPLRYGAGVKGKTIEAMYHRIPLVSTSVGIEGMDGAEDCVETADTSEGFADAVLRYYKDRDAAKQGAVLCAEYIDSHYSKAVLQSMLKDLLG